MTSGSSRCSRIIRHMGNDRKKLGGKRNQRTLNLIVKARTNILRTIQRLEIPALAHHTQEIDSYDSLNHRVGFEHKMHCNTVTSCDTRDRKNLDTLGK